MNAAHRAQNAYRAAVPSDAALLTRHASLIQRVARRIASRMGSAEAAAELWSAGALGLLDAAARFDPQKDVKFETFAEHRIRGAMLDELRRTDHLPRRLRQRTEALNKGRRELAQTLGRDATPDELAAKLETTTDEVAALEQLNQPAMPLTPDLAVATDEPAMDDRIARQQGATRLAGAIGELPERLRLLLSLHYVEELSYKEISQVLKVSEPRVCQLHAQALGKLRETLGDSARELLDAL